MRCAPWWVLLPSACAPFLLVGAWCLAQEWEGAAYDPVSTTISVLAAHGAPGYWLMTAILFALGGCYVATAFGLRTAAVPGRAALAGGGLAALCLTLVPAPRHGGDLGHGTVATVGFLLLGLWPTLAVARARPHPAPRAPWGLRPRVGIAVSVAMGLGAVWFLIALLTSRAPGVAERALTLTQALWPLLVVLSCLRVPKRHGVGRG